MGVEGRTSRSRHTAACLLGHATVLVERSGLAFAGPRYQVSCEGLTDCSAATLTGSSVRGVFIETDGGVESHVC